MGRKLLVFILAVTFVISMIGCGSTNGNNVTTEKSIIEQTSTAEPSITEAKKEIAADVTLWAYPLFDKLDQFYNEQIGNKLKEQFPGINVKAEIIPWDGGPNKVNVAIASGTTPDIIEEAPMRAYSYASKGVLVPLDEEIEAIKEGILEKYLDSCVFEGKRYLSPVGTTGVACNVNVTLAKELGVFDLLPADFESWNFDDFRKFISTATEKGKSQGIYGAALWAGSQSSDSVTFSLLMGAGANTLNPEKNKVILNSPEGVKGLDFLAGLVKDKLVAPGAPTMKDEDALTLFFNKKIVMCINGDVWSVGEVAKQLISGTIKAPFETALYMFPSFDGKTHNKVGWDAGGYCIFKNANDEMKIAAAKEVVKLCTGTDALVSTFLKNSGSLPVRSGMSIYSDDPAMDKEAQKITNWLKYDDSKYGSQLTYWPEIRAVFYPEIQAAYVGEKTAQQALDDFTKKANEIMDKNEQK